MVRWSTEDTLEWARGRVPILISRIEDPRLLAILDPRPDGQPTDNGVCKPPSESSSGSALHTPETFSLRIESWAQFADLYRGDIRRRRLQVASDQEPRLGHAMEVALILPVGAGSFRLRAEVVVSSRTAYELEVLPLTGELEFLFESLIEHTSDGTPGTAWIEAVRRGLRARLRGADAALLGLETDATPAAIQDAYTRLRSTWEFFLGEGPVTEPLRPVLDEYGALLGRVCARLVLPRSERREASGPAGIHRPRPAAPRTPVRTAPVAAAPPPAKTAAEPSSAVVKNARRFIARLAPRPRARPEPIPARVPTPPNLGRVYAYIASRDYDQAETFLCDALQRDPQHERAQQLLHLVRARRAVEKRDFSSAKRIYEALLRRDPKNEAANKELLMISALA